MPKRFKSSDPSFVIVIILTFVLFGLALFYKGFTHDLLLEGAVFLVSLKLILMSRENTEVANRLEAHLQQTQELLARREPAESELKEQE